MNRLTKRVTKPRRRRTPRAPLEVLRQEKTWDSRRLAMITRQGSVLLVLFDKSWGFVVLGPARLIAARYGFSADTTEERVISAARKHAGEHFGGIRWEQQF